jgi:hypothetical protein
VQPTRLLGTDSRPVPPGAGGDGGPGPGTPAPGGPMAGLIPAGFAVRGNLTIPLATLLDLADRPGELGGIGPIDPDPGANTPDRYQACDMKLSVPPGSAVSWLVGHLTFQPELETVSGLACSAETHHAAAAGLCHSGDRTLGSGSWLGPDQWSS